MHRFPKVKHTLDLTLVDPNDLTFGIKADSRVLSLDRGEKRNRQS
jgi:hypothetical protein